jgi:hypothetical protein
MKDGEKALDLFVTTYRTKVIDGVRPGGRGSSPSRALENPYAW